MVNFTNHLFCDSKLKKNLVTRENWR